MLDDFGGPAILGNLHLSSGSVHQQSMFPLLGPGFVPNFEESPGWNTLQ